MITMKQIRKKDGQHYDYDDQSLTPARAFEILVNFEMSYGCTIIALTETTITTRTRVLSCVDDTTFIGPEDDMQELVNIAAIYCQHHQASMENGVLKSAIVERVMSFSKGKPLMVKLGADMVSGGMIARLSLMTAITDLPEKLEVLEKLTRSSLKDLAAMVGLIKFEGVQFDEALTLL